MIEFYRIDTFINEAHPLWLGFAETIFGTLLGFGGAFIVAAFFYQRQLNSERKKQDEKFASRLNFLSNLIGSALKTAKMQLDHFTDLRKDIVDKPTEQHFLKITASKNLERLQRMDTEEVFHAYQKIIPDTADKDKYYHDIYSHIDFIYSRLEQSLTSTDRYFQFLHRDQMIVKEAIDELATDIFNWIKILEKNMKTNTSEYVFLVESHSKYVELVEEQSNIGEIEKAFLVDFAVILYTNYKNQPFFGDFYTLAQKAILRLNHIKYNSTHFVNELSDLNVELYDKFEKLDKLRQILTSHNML